MKNKGISLVIELTCFALSLNFFYEGIYKFVHFHEYVYWMRNIPYLHIASTPLTYIVPFVEIVLSILFLISFSRIAALYTAVLFLVLFIVYLMVSLLISSRLFFPFDSFWGHTKWFAKMLFLLLLSWLSIMAIMLSKRNENSNMKIT